MKRRQEERRKRRETSSSLISYNVSWAWAVGQWRGGRKVEDKLLCGLVRRKEGGLPTGKLLERREEPASEGKKAPSSLRRACIYNV